MDSSTSVPSPNSLPSNPDMETKEIHIPIGHQDYVDRATSQDHQTPQNPPVPQNSPLLEDLEKESEEERKNVELYRARCTADKTELYHLVGFYSVFQGVVFGAVANSPILTCQTSLLPALLSLLVSVATAISVHFKLRDYEIDRCKLITSEHLVEFAKDRVTLVKAKMFDFYRTQEIIKEKLDAQKLRKLEEERRSCRNFYRVVMLFMLWRLNNPLVNLTG